MQNVKKQHVIAKMKKSQLRNIIRESIREVMNELTNPFTGGGSGPNWQDAEDAWQNWDDNNQSGAPSPNQTFLSAMNGRGCGFYQKRLTAQLNSFVHTFGGSFGAGSNASDAPNQGQNPAWQSEKYARIMWLASAVQDCNSQTSTAVGCINDWIDDTSNDTTLTSATCANGNTALSPSNIQNMQFRWKSRADCASIEEQINDLNDQIIDTQGCNTIRKTAKRDYLQLLANHCC